MQSAGKALGMAQKLLARFGLVDDRCCFFVGALFATVLLLRSDALCCRLESLGTRAFLLLLSYFRLSAFVGTTTGIL